MVPTTVAARLPWLHDTGGVVRRWLSAAAAVLAVTAAAALGSNWISAAAHATALEHTVVAAERLAVSTIAPAVDQAVLDGDKAAIARLDQLVTARKENGSVVRVKVWDSGGRIVYSDEPALVGRRFELAGDELALLSSGGSAAGLFQSPQEEENAFEAGLGPLVEVYSAATSGSGQPLLFESYITADDVSAVQRGLVGRVAPVLTLLVVVALGSLAVWTASQRRALAVRTTAASHAAAAAALQRRRIARLLRNETLQGMAGVGYALESLSPALGDGPRALAEKATSAVQHDLGRLRRLVDVLERDAAGETTLPAALVAVADALREAGTTVELRLRRPLDVGSDTAHFVAGLVAEITSTTPVAPPAAVHVTVGGDRKRLHLALNVQGPHRCAGLETVRDAVEAAGGRMESCTSHVQHCSLEIELPVR